MKKLVDLCLNILFPFKRVPDVRREEGSKDVSWLAVGSWPGGPESLLSVTHRCSCGFVREGWVLCSYLSSTPFLPNLRLPIKLLMKRGVAWIVHDWFVAPNT